MRKLLVGVSAASLLLSTGAFATVEQDNLAIPASTSTTYSYNVLANWDCVSSHTNCNMGTEIMVPGSVTPMVVSSASSALASQTNALPVVSFLFGYNGSTWDQLQDDASKNLKVNLAAGTIQWGAGTSNNGQLQAPLTVLSGANETTFNSLTTGSYLQSSVSGTSGVFTNANTGQAQVGDFVYTSGGTFSPTAGGNITIWFNKTDGTNYEVCSANLARPPDAIIPLPTSVAASVSYWSQGTHAVVIPAYKFKLCIQNNSGATTGATSNVITLISPPAVY